MRHALLAFDTSTEMMAVALDAGGTTLKWNGPGGASASAQLLPRIAAMLASQGLSANELAAVAYGRGPGAFTGLRTAAAVAQGLAFGAGVPVLPVDSLLIVAEDARAGPGMPGNPGQVTSEADIGVAMDARMGELYAARYEWKAGDWHTTMEPALYTPQALRAAWHAQVPVHLAGNGMQILAQADSAQLPPLPEPLPLHDRAAALMRLAQRMHARGLGVEAAHAVPVYLRNKVALTTQERLQAQRR